MDWKDILATLQTDSQSSESHDNTPYVDNPVDNTADNTKTVQKEALHIVMERKGRAGKTATIVEGFVCDDNTLNDIARKLKNAMGCGGSARGSEILLQGDRRQQAAEKLRQMGFKVKL